MGQFVTHFFYFVFTMYPVFIGFSGSIPFLGSGIFCVAVRIERFTYDPSRMVKPCQA